MLNSTHLFYMLNTGIVCALLLSGLFLLGNRNLNKFFVGLLAMSTLFLHYIVELRDFFENGETVLGSDMVLPIYPCHICMWLLILSAMLLDKTGPLPTLIKDMTFWAGTICGSIGTIFNINFDENPNLSDLFVLKGLLSHTTMVCGCILLFVGGFVKIRVGRSLAATLFGIAFFFSYGTTVNSLFEYFTLPPANSMFLQNIPEGYPEWLSVRWIALAVLVVVLVVSLVFEQVFVKKEERWYYGWPAYFQAHFAKHGNS